MGTLPPTVQSLLLAAIVLMPLAGPLPPPLGKTLPYPWQALLPNLQAAGIGPQGARAQTRPSEQEARQAAERWLENLGPRGLVLTHTITPTAEHPHGGFQGQWITSPHWQGTRTTLVLQDPNWSIQLGFRGALSPQSDRSRARRLFDFLTLDRLPTPGLSLPGWEVRPLTPSSHVEQGVEILSFGKGRIRLRVRTRFFALYGHDPEAIRRLPADARAPAGSTFRIERSFPLDLLLDAPLHLPASESRGGST